MSSVFRELAIATHLLGMVLWIGGITACALIGAAVAREGEAGRAALAAVRRAALMIASPGMVIAWLAGLAYLVPNFSAIYARQGWMHAKLTIVFVLAGITGVLTGHLRKAAAGKKPASPGLLGGLGLTVVVLAGVVVFLAMLKPGV